MPGASNATHTNSGVKFGEVRLELKAKKERLREGAETSVSRGARPLGPPPTGTFPMRYLQLTWPLVPWRVAAARRATAACDAVRQAM